ncbi:MAG: tRNA lysidine(34) synthetase TilS [Candidatus Kapabacteria bacterium]|nr:tRNA lysidine(34) synthetase TilS [Candidatus Kapabacteria bacterium]
MTDQQPVAEAVDSATLSADTSSQKKKKTATKSKTATKKTAPKQEASSAALDNTNVKDVSNQQAKKAKGQPKKKAVAKKDEPAKPKPSLEEVAAFIQSIKPKREANAEQAQEEKTPANQVQQKNAASSKTKSLPVKPEQKNADTQQKNDKAPQVTEEQPEQITSEQPQKGISRREQRRLDWLEKRRVWREQKFLERQARKLAKQQSAPEQGTEQPNDGVDSVPVIAEVQQPQPKQQEKGRKQKGNSKPEAKTQELQETVETPVDETQEATNEQHPEGKKKNRRGGKKHRERMERREARMRSAGDGDAHGEDEVEQHHNQDAKLTPLQRAQKELHSVVKQADDAHANAQQPAPSSKEVVPDKKNTKKGKKENVPVPAPEKQTQEQPAKKGAKKDEVKQPQVEKPQQQRTQQHPAEQKQQKGRQQEHREQKGKQQEPREQHKKTERQQTSHEPPPLPEPKKLVLPPKKFFIPKDITQKPDVSDNVHALISKVEQYITEELDMEDGSTILVAVSGGVDSVVLLDVLYILSYEHGYTLNTVHVNHNLRATAKRDERFVRHISEKYDVPSHTTQVNVTEFAKKHKLSEEEAGRELRYKFFRQTSSTIRANYCATAHNADDSAETMLMNLFRGTGLTGLASIPPRRTLIKKTQLVRPLLSLTKQEILEYAKLRELEWNEDETNTFTKYTRNKVRHDLLPKLKDDYNPNIIKSLNRTANLLRRADGFIDSLIYSTYTDVVTEEEDKTLIDVAKFSALHEFMQGEITERAITTVTYGKPVSFNAIDRVLGLISKKPGVRETVVNNLVAVRERESIVLMYEQHIQEVYLSIYKLGEYTIGSYKLTLDEVTRNDVRIGAEQHVEYFDYDALPYRLTLRTWHPGDHFHPIGMKGHMSVSDFLTNIKVEHTERAGVLVLATPTDIIWVCGHRISDDFKLGNDTRRIIRATFTKE